MYKFAAAQEDEITVFGASRPGYSDKKVADWVSFMKEQDIKKVCCLLCANQLARYSNLLGIYQQKFGNNNVCWAPIEDFHLSDLANLIQKILPFLREAEQQGDKVVVHCSGGIGRTGHILAAWLVNSRGLSNKAAIDAVKRNRRNPYEFVIAASARGENPFKALDELNLLLNNCRIQL